ncbi:MAG: hypothetical protein EZS28_049784 [Streblomastix strix]|uniref:Tyr recombinase domain-containing protein n=1 Tax=Streblomastix strix TaxID=222440 RepID=A0A5J4T921_9EUKA|nr:MAG: hypothetical protein EZS28_049784 [Streblomastix strix]
MFNRILENKALSHHAIKDARTSSSVLFDKAGIKLENGLISSITRKQYRESAKIQKELSMWDHDILLNQMRRIWNKYSIKFTSSIQYTWGSATRENCRARIRQLLFEAGISKLVRVTDIRATALTKLICSGVTKEEADRWSRHSQSAETREAFPQRGQRIVTTMAMKRPPQGAASRFIPPNKTFC